MSPSKRATARILVAGLSATVLALGLVMAQTAPSQASTGQPAKSATLAHPASSKSDAASPYILPTCSVAKASTNGVPNARCFAEGKPGAAGTATPLDGPPATATTPAELQAAYNLPNAGAGMTVAIVDALGYDNAEADLQVYRNQFGLPACTTANGCFTKLDETGGTNYPPQDAGWSIETALDLDAVSSVCPLCKIALVEGNSTSFDDLGEAADTAASLPGVVAISNSYGSDGGEDPSELTYDHYYDHPGIAVTVSTGDNGWVPTWPAASGNVVAVGGTSLTQDSSSPRGWTESAWSGAGSYCSPYEAKPAFQDDVNTTCNQRAYADISADADPNTGLAVYNTLGQSGWGQWGGTSLSSPLVAGMYALAGQPVPGTYPNSYPYLDTADLNDVTTGSNGSCGSPICTAGTGWDGPTGLGTPNGINALTTGPHGVLAGSVTASGGGALSGAAITATDSDGTSYHATTGTDGSYTLSVPTGTYDVTASAFGYASQTDSGVDVTTGNTITESFSLTAVPSHTVSGTITDGSGHGWPLYAKVTVAGAPGSTYTDPYTGKYSLTLPEGATYQLNVASAELPGYQTVTQSVDIGTSNQKVDIGVPVDVNTCAASGYTVHYQGSGTDFEGWTDTPQDGWSVVNGSTNTGGAWTFNDPGNRGNKTGGSGSFAIADSDHAGPGSVTDSSLVTPVMDFSSNPNPVVIFDHDYFGFPNSVADVDVSIDGGTTWNTVAAWTTSSTQGHQEIPIPSAANQSDVQVRFHYTGSWAFYWQLDNIIIGSKSCDPDDGALVGGIVKDNNTGSGLNGAKVAVDGDASELGISAATPDDANLGDGFYELFSKAADQGTGGKVSLTATDGKYVAASAKVAVVNDGVAQKDWSLKAGHLTVSGNVSVAEQLGVAKSKTVTFGNDGTQSVHVKLAEKGAAFTPMSGTPAATDKGAPLAKVAGTFTMGMLPKSAGKASLPSARTSGITGSDAWSPIADMPASVMDNAAVTVDGKVYSFGGTNGLSNLNSTYIYDPDAGAWSSGAPIPAALEKPSAEAVDGEIYVFGGWDTSGNASSNAYKYDPSSDSWSSVASLPTGVVAPGTAVLDGKIYSFGGCTTGNCAPGTNATQIYDPSSNSWSQGAPYPMVNGWFSCAGLSDQIYCAGGSSPANGAEFSNTYAYDPGSDSWSSLANMPYANWAAVSTGANGELQVAQGVSGGFAVNSAVQYDPSSDSWSALPNANQSVYRGAGACGFYSLGGSTGGFSPIPAAEELPGFSECGSGADTTWLSEDKAEFDVAPGAKVTVTVTLDSTQVDQPGTYASGLGVSTDSPYTVPAIGATMNVTPPASWAKINGTVTGAGVALKGATVEICTMYVKQTGLCGPVTYTLSTDANGYYQVWLAQGYSPLSVIAADNGYAPKMSIVKLTKGATSTSNFALAKS